MFVSLALMPLTLALAGDLEIKDVKVGKGAQAQAGDYITVNYTGRLKSNGKQFDSSVGKAPFSFMLGAGMVIKGWDKGVSGMKEGGKRLLTIPSSMGYGARGAGSDIPPNADLVFEVELLNIDRAKIETLAPGKGKGAAFGDMLKVHYKGMFTSGKEFDSSYKRGEPMEVPLEGRGLIPGFIQGLIGMKKGEKRKITIPPKLGYGDAGAGGVIPPNATLVFELELVDLTKR
jgi:FKBP-type peptidyl-prolyl cis-trans isomerase